MLKENISILEKQRYYLKPFPEDGEFAYTTNNLGFRATREMDPVKKKGVKRIFLVGASLVEFAQFKDTSLPQLLENQLRKGSIKGDTFEVINAGMAEALAKDHIDLIKNKILPLEPDLILYYWSPRQEIWRGSKGVDCRAKKSKYEDSCWLRGQNPLFRFLHARSILFRLLAKSYPFLQRDLAKSRPDHVYQIDRDSEFAREYALDLDKLMLFAQKAKVPFMAVEMTAATMAEGFGRPFEPGSLLERTMEIDLYPLTQTDINAFFAFTNEMLFSAASARKIPICRVKPRLAVEDFLDYVHFSRKGLPKVADWFAECADRYFRAGTGERQRGAPSDLKLEKKP